MDIFSDATMSPGETDGTYDVRLSLSLTGAIAVIVLDFFRERPFLRFATGLFGIPLLLASVWAVFSISFDWWDTAVYGALLTSAAVFSSSRFYVYMAADDPQDAIAETSSVGAPAETGLAPLEAALRESLDGEAQSQGRARTHFQWGLVALVVSVTMCVAVVWRMLTGGDMPPGFSLLASAGLALGMLSGFLLHSSGKAQKVAARFGRQVYRLRELEVAVALVGSAVSEDSRALARSRVLDLLLEPWEGDRRGGILLPAIDEEDD